MIFTILPLKGVQWGCQSIFFGEEKIDVETKLGNPEVIDNSFYYFKSNLRVDFSPNGKVECIEFLGGIAGDIQPVIYGVQVFQEEADELYHVLEKNNSGEVVDMEDGYSYAFPNIGIGVYRESIPSNVVELIQELQKTGIDITDHPNIKEEQLKAMHWATISVVPLNYPW